MQQPIAVEFAEQVLAVRHRLDHARLVQLCGRLSEAALRAGNRHHLAAKSFCEVEGEPVQRVALRQDPSFQLVAGDWPA
jgi:hypothetical protein